MISGSWPGQLYLFRREEDGSFAAREEIRDKAGKPVRVGSASAVFAFDWNGDGALDLLVGNIEGHVYLVPNEGTTAEPAFGEPVKLKAKGQEIQVPGGDAGPVVADWDGDGLDDLLVGNGDGSVHFYRNTGTREKPELDEARVLVAATEHGFGGASEEEADDAPPRPGMRAKICVTDWNGDGRLDLLLGDFSMKVIRRRGLTEDEKKLKAELDKKWEALVEEYVAVFEELRKETKNQDEEDDFGFNLSEEQMEKLEPFQKRLQELHEERSKYETERHEPQGNVWVFLRRDVEEVAGGR